MAVLDKKIPPLVVVVIAAVGMWALAGVLPGINLPYWPRMSVALLLFLAGAAVCVAGVVEFRRSQTTVDPRKPETTSSLVTSGIYSRTRNPMYAGFTLMLLAWAVYLASLWSVLGVVAFVAYLDRFQIQPEERALAALFGEEFERYKSAVRRWV